jgi:phage anti-repressor protein
LRAGNSRQKGDNWFKNIMEKYYKVNSRYYYGYSDKLKASNNYSLIIDYKIN